MTAAFERQLGRNLAQKIQQDPQISSQRLEALLADLLADDLSLRAPLRELILLPGFRLYVRDQGAAHAIATRDALLSELSSSFQPELLLRINAVLEGYLELTGDRIDRGGSTLETPSPSPSPSPSPQPPSPKRLDGSGSATSSSIEPLVQNVGGKLPDISGVSPQMMVRLRRIHALVQQGYRVEKQLGTFPFLRSPTGQNIPVSLWRKGYAGGSWIGFFFPFFVCCQIRDYSYFWYICAVYTLTSTLFLATKVDLTNVASIVIGIQYALYIPYLRYLSIQSGVRPRSVGMSILIGLLLSGLSVVPSIVIESFAPGS